MSRAMLGDLIEWGDEEYAVAAAAPGGTLLQRLADGVRMWVDLPTLTVKCEGRDHAHRPAARGWRGPRRVRHVHRRGPDGRPLVEPHINEVIHGIPDPADHAVTPRPGHEDPSKTRRRALKAKELAAAGIAVTARTQARKEKLHLAYGVYGLVDRRTTVAGALAPRTDDRPRAGRHRGSGRHDDGQHRLDGNVDQQGSCPAAGGASGRGCSDAVGSHDAPPDRRL